MRKSIILGIPIIALMFFLVFFAAQSSASKEVIKMVGEITAIDFINNTVVVEVPVGKTMHEKRLFTVGGPLASDAELIKESGSANLEDFKVGDRVTVKWKTIDTGHLILSLKKNQKK